MQLSHRIETLTPGGADGWEVFVKSKALIAEGVAVTELTIGEHDIRTDPTILGAMDASARGGRTGYAEVPGIGVLRDKVAARITERTGVATGRDNVLITPGGQAGLFAAHCAVCDPGDAALFIDPYYVTYPGTLRAVGARPVSILTRAETGFLPSEAAILDAVTPDAKSLLINSPNNPTGAIYGRETLEEIGRACDEAGLWLISDEVYDTQVWDGTHLSPRALPGMAERTLVIGSMSKSHAMTGSRCGWIVGPDHAIARLISLATHTTYGVPGFVQEAALFALDQGSELEERIAAPFRRRRALAQRILAGQNTLRMLPPQGAMYVMLDVRATGLSGDAFADALLEAERIAVMPGESFGQAAAGHIRVAMTIEDEAFAEALERLCGFAAGLAAAKAS
ncbi:pyridoxal phosphate-dependent aminotransferase [Pseudodonghicola xiamenensis]|uniref:aspartate transaminase n=1 Tax=Pseudodonghicola xiamenensis TaxID=337702 RepID=A0A8J3H7I9_9RHOB|nr:pyridoxal phosphate-dependent aminotransferase [Pseudodonghicola xiamenensis]GHG87755.1 aminotransferase [Pseudodonghicola xiamenensis]